MEIVIIGAGGHAKVVIDIVEKRQEILNEKISIFGIVDDNHIGKDFLGYSYLGKIEDLKKIKDYEKKNI